MLCIKSLKSTPPTHAQNYSYPHYVNALRVTHLRQLSCMRTTLSEVRYAS